MRIVNPMAIPITSSGVIFGPLESTSKNRMIPNELLGPDIPGPLVIFTIIFHQKKIAFSYKKSPAQFIKSHG